MYRNLAWFTLGYFTCKHVMPIVDEVTRKLVEKQRANKAEAS